MREQDRVELSWAIRSMHRSLMRTTYVISLDRAAAIDATREACVQLAARWREVRRDERPELWVQSVAVEAALRRARTAGRGGATVGEDQGWPDVGLWRALGELPAGQRAGVALHDLEQRPLEEVAAALGTSLGGAVLLLTRAHAGLERERVPELVGAPPAELRLGARLATLAEPESVDLEAELAGILERGATVRRRRRLAWTSVLVVLVVAVALVTSRPHVVVRTLLPPLAEWVDMPPAQRLPEDVGTTTEPQPIPPGRYEVHIRRYDRATAIVRVPEGWGQADDATLMSGPVDDDGSRRFEVWVLAVIGTCDGRIIDDGDTVTTASERLAERGSLPATAPEATSLAGRQAAFLRLGPAGAEQLEDCWPPRQPVMWHAVGPTKLYENLGWTELVWVVQVEGRILVVNAAHGPEASEQEVDQLVEMAESVTFRRIEETEERR